MYEQAGAIRTADPSDPSIRRRRIDALQRALRARAVLDREADLLARYGDGEPPGDDDHDGELPGAYRDDVDRLIEIHRNLGHERHVARRPFHRHSERLVLALELAERLALDRLGFDDYADFEAHEGDGGRAMIDVDLLDRAARELADAEAILAELDGIAPRAPSAPAEPVLVRLPAWTVDPILRDGSALRATRARRQLFGGGEPGLVDPDRSDQVVISAWPLPFRNRPTRRMGTAAEARAGRSEERVLGEIVHNGRTLRVEQIEGLDYDDDDEQDLDRGITYGEPNRPGGARPG